MTFCGKEASCYCLQTGILSSTEQKRHKHACGRGDCGGASCLPLPRPPRPFMLIAAVQTRFAPYSPVLPSLTGRPTRVPTVNPNENKQPLARRDSRKPFVFTKWIWGEQVCFAGSGCLPLCRLGPGPWAVSGPGEVGGRGGETGSDMDALAARTRGDSQVALLQPCLHRADVTKPPMRWTFKHRARRHHGKYHRSPTPVFTINTRLISAI